MSGAFQVQALPNRTTIIGLPETGGSGIIKFYGVNLTLASDFAGARVRLATGNPDRPRPQEVTSPLWKIMDPLPVPAGRIPLSSAPTAPIFVMEPYDEVASIVHSG